MPRPRPIVSDATVESIKRTVLNSPYPMTARQVRESVERSDAVVRQVLTWLVEDDTLGIDRKLTPIRYFKRGELSIHGQVWRTLYTTILDHTDIRMIEADELARHLVELIESSGALASRELNDETNRWNAERKTKRK